MDTNALILSLIPKLMDLSNEDKDQISLDTMERLNYLTHVTINRLKWYTYDKIKNEMNSISPVPSEEQVIVELEASWEKVAKASWDGYDYPQNIPEGYESASEAEHIANDDSFWNG